MKISVNEKILGSINAWSMFPLSLEKIEREKFYGYKFINKNIADSVLYLVIDEKTDLELSYVYSINRYLHPDKRIVKIIGIKVQNYETVSLLCKSGNENRKEIDDKLIKDILLKNIILVPRESIFEYLLMADNLDLMFLLGDKKTRVEILNTLLNELSVNLEKIKVEKVNIKKSVEDKDLNTITKLILDTIINYKGKKISLDLEWNINTGIIEKHLTINNKIAEEHIISQALLDKIIEEKNKNGE